MNVAPAFRGTAFLGGFRVWQRNRDAFLRGWKVEVGGIAIEPFVILVAMGFGLGSYVEGFGELSYAEFVAPGILASYAMWHASFDSTFGAYLRMETHHVYEAMLFTPLGPEDIVMGEVISSASRAVLTGTAVLVASLVFGLVSSPLAVLAIPVAFLTGLAFASISMVVTATITTIGSLNNFFTLVLTPMFFLGGVFFPLDRLPDAARVAAWVAPLTPASALVRGFVTGDLSWWMVLWVMELIVISVAFYWLATFFLRRKLIN